MILTFVMLFFLASSEPQLDPVSYWDAVLVQYEKLSEASLKNENAKEISRLKKTLDEMLKQPVGKMNEEQIRRFQAIKKRHAGIDIPDSPPARVDTLIIIQQIPVEKIREIEHIVVTDTVSRIEQLGKIQMEHVFSKRDTTVVMHVVHPSAEQYRPSEQAKACDTKNKSFIMYAGLAGTVYPTFSGGGVFGIGKPKIGGYFKGCSNFNSVKPAYQFDASGEIAPGTYFWGDGTGSLSRMTFTAGAYFTIAGIFGGYAGAGWGKHSRYYRDISGNWAELKDDKSSGLSLDVGIGLNPGRFRIFAGVNCTSFHYFDVEIGVAFDIIKK